MSPVKVAEYHFSAAANGEKEKFFHSCFLPVNKNQKEKLTGADFKTIQEFHQRFQIKIVEGKVFENLAVVGKCEFDTDGKLRDVDAIVLRKSDQQWKVIKAANALAVKMELSAKENLDSFSKAIDWLRSNPRILNERALNLKH